MAAITGLWQAKLLDMLDALGEDTVQEILATFSCPVMPTQFEKEQED